MRRFLRKIKNWFRYYDNRREIMEDTITLSLSELEKLRESKMEDAKFYTESKQTEYACYYQGMADMILELLKREY